MAEFHTMLQLEELARKSPREFRSVPHRVCLEATRAYLAEEREKIRQRHAAGESGHNTLTHLTELSDKVVESAVTFALAYSRNAHILMSRVAICALGGYGRGEMSPFSDLDVALLFDSTLDSEIEALSGYLMPFFWDIGYQAGYSLHSVTEAAELAAQDPRVFTSYVQGRLLMGDNTTLGRLKLSLTDATAQTRGAVLQYIRQREHTDDLPLEHRDLYALEPDVKENAGGLRDFHAGLWMVLLTHGSMNLDDMARMGFISPIEYLELLEGLDFLWRVRNELHFHSGREEDRLTFAMQKHIAPLFGYGGDRQQSIRRFMEDYYAAAVKVHGFLQIAARICDQPSLAALFDEKKQGRSKLSVYHGQLCADPTDKNWFVENPTRLMEVFWESARRMASLSPALSHWVNNSLHLVNEEFRANDVVRRYFVAICNRPLQAGIALRAAARCGLLGAYLPEFAAIQGTLCYEDFHTYPVDEHTIRAIEAISQIPRIQGEIGKMLYRVLERIRDPHVLVLSILFHDLGKVVGEIHTEQSTILSEQICRRIGISEYDMHRINMLVNYHMLMSEIAFYRDTDDPEIVSGFAQKLKTDDQLRMLLLLTYADLCAVGPNVWTDWKGALLFKLFLKAERILMGRTSVSSESFWNWPKAKKIAEYISPERSGEIEAYLQTLGERYLIAFTPEQIALHMECLEEALCAGIALRISTNPTIGASEVVVCTRDRHGLFSKITGSFASQLINVQSAALFTREDGWVVDCFTVEDAAQKRPLTKNEFVTLKSVLYQVIIEECDVKALVEQSKNKLFALQQSTIPVCTIVELNNEASHTDTVIDIVTGDRTGLLYDISSTLSSMGIDFSSAHIMTDVGRVRDSFYVKYNNRKLEEMELQDRVRRQLLECIHPMHAHEMKEENE